MVLFPPSRRSMTETHDNCCHDNCHDSLGKAMKLDWDGLSHIEGMEQAMTANREELVSGFCEILLQMASLHDEQQRGTTCFHSSKVPKISLLDYLNRIITYSQCSDGCLVFCLAYIDRVRKACPHFVWNHTCLHRLVMSSMLAAAKFLDDTYFVNAFYAMIGGVSTAALFKLESEFLRLLDWQLQVSPAEYSAYLKVLLVAVHGDDLVLPWGEARYLAVAWQLQEIADAIVEEEGSEAAGNARGGSPPGRDCDCDASTAAPSDHSATTVSSAGSSPSSPALNPGVCRQQICKVDDGHCELA